MRTETNVARHPRELEKPSGGNVFLFDFYYLLLSLYTFSLDQQTCRDDEMG